MHENGKGAWGVTSTVGIDGVVDDILLLADVLHLVHGRGRGSGNSRGRLRLDTRVVITDASWTAAVGIPQTLDALVTHAERLVWIVAGFAYTVLQRTHKVSA